MISVRDVSHTYQGPPRTDALQGVSLEVQAGEVVGIVGRSGCGKTTLLNIIGGLLEPTSGTVSVSSLSAETARRKRKFGVVFQNPVLLPWRSVEGNIRLPFELGATRNSDAGRLGADELADHIRKAAARVGLEEFLSAFPSQLSGGMKARVAVARALAYRPTVLLMDEPFGSLDEITRTRINDDFLLLQEQTKTTVVLVTHSLQEALFLSDRVIVFSPRPGRIDMELAVPREEGRRGWRDSPRFAELWQKLREALV